MALKPVLDLAEEDYRYGTGRLRLRYEKRIIETRMSDGVWVTVLGVEVRWDGTDGDRRLVAVPADVLDRQLADARRLR